jgi:hypothetical protein
MQLSGVRVIHAIPGRIRLKIAKVRDNPALALEVEEHLARIPGVERVEANPATGSVLVVFADRPETSEDSIRMLSDTWPATLTPLDLGTFDPGHANGTTNGNGHGGPAVDRRIVELLGSVNAGVGRVTQGVDLKLLLPLGLFVLGLRSVLFSDKLASPAWYDFFWFALGTFMMLNPTADPETSAARVTSAS